MPVEIAIRGRRLLSVCGRAFWGLSRKLSRPQRLLAGYAALMIGGWAALSLPFMQVDPVAAVDVLFIAASAVSTTGLVTVSPGDAFTGAGQLVILLLIQVGGIGYMAVATFMLMTLQKRISRAQSQSIKEEYDLPDKIDMRYFVKAIIIYTVIVEAIGAAALFWFFTNAGVENAAWSAVFHAISAFCTAGFSLYGDSLSAFRNHAGVNIVVIALCLAGSIGFLVVIDAWRTVLGREKRLGFASIVIIRMTIALVLGGAVLMALVDPGLDDLAARERLLVALFQSASAASTAGFNTWPVDQLTTAALVPIIFLMIIGASPAGTGGGIKTTSLAAMLGLVGSTLRGRRAIAYHGHPIPLTRLQTAAATSALYAALLGVALYLLLALDPQLSFESAFFEIASALSTVGLSIGATGELSELSKLVVIVLMTAGRLGILTFAVALSVQDEEKKAEKTKKSEKLTT